MTINNLIKKTCKALGENNKPTYVVMAIATVKGICRPVFTMMDKTESPETKKYTALREGLTEAIAIPAYWGCGEIAGKLASKCFEDKHLASRAKTNLMFIGVCTAALFVIPALCSVAIKPIMDKLGLKAPEKKEDKKLDINSQAPQMPKTPILQNNKTALNYYSRAGIFNNNIYSGMKAGRV